MLKLLNPNIISGILTPLYSLQTFPLFQPFSTTTTTTTTTTATALTQPNNLDFIEYLIKSLNFTPKQAHKISTKLSHIRQSRGTKSTTNFTTHQIQNANNVISYLQQIGAQHSLIINTISSLPDILLCNVQKTLKPKTEFFQKLGFSGSDFIQLLKSNPALIFLGLDTCIVPAYHNLIKILGSDRLVIKLFKIYPTLRINTVSKTLVPNVALLRSYGISDEQIQRKFMSMPGSFCRNPRVFEELVVRVEEMLGIPRDSTQFLTGIQLLTSFKAETIEAKKEIFRSCGWSESDIVAILRTKPSCFTFSSDMIRKKLRFFMEELGYEPKYLITNMFLFTCSLEKRIVPRYKVLVMLKKKGVIEMEHSLAKVNCLNEDRFLEMFVIPYEDVHEVYAKHTGISIGKLREYRN